jgi:hypothetical protein
MKEFYLARLEDGWSLVDIDECDFFYLLNLMAYRENKKKSVTIDQIF